MSSSSLTGKVAVVTGASRGIGAAIARRLAADGAKVVVNYSKNAPAADQVVAEITSAGGEATAVQADVSDRAQVARMFADTQTAYGRLDILVNNAGTAEPAPLDGMTDATMEEHTPAGLGIYGASKAAVEALTSSLARELGPRGITVNAIRPGSTETELFDSLSDDASFITGQSLAVSGGASL